MAKHYIVPGSKYSGSSSVNLYRDPKTGDVRDRPDETHYESFQIPVRRENGRAFAEPIVSDEQLTSLASIFSN